MGRSRRDGEEPGLGSEGKGGRITVTVDFDPDTYPELHALVRAVAPGKQRAERIRSLMIKGHMVELMRSLPAIGVSRTAVASVPSSGGAEDVFGDPLDG